MPTKSAAQQRLMRAAAHTPGGFGGVSQKVGREFTNADQRTGVRYAEGGSVMAEKKLEDAVNERSPPSRASKGGSSFYPDQKAFPGAIRQGYEGTRKLKALMSEVEAGYSKGGMVKAGSPKVTAPCRDSKTIKC